jgi:hypothetical protein
MATPRIAGWREMAVVTENVALKSIHIEHIGGQYLWLNLIVDTWPPLLIYIPTTHGYTPKKELAKMFRDLARKIEIGPEGDGNGRRAP